MIFLFTFYLFIYLAAIFFITLKRQYRTVQDRRRKAYKKLYTITKLYFFALTLTLSAKISEIYIKMEVRLTRKA